MSVGYRAVQWNRNKIVYDVIAAAAAAASIWSFLNLWPLTGEGGLAVNPQIQLMRAYGATAFLLLTAVLMIGPLARLDSRFLPLVYNRRHLGVLTAVVAWGHVWFVLAWYHGLSDTPQVVSVVSAALTGWGGPGLVPVEAAGLFGLAILTVMAATSHDFWNRFLGTVGWKSLHMGVYAAWGALCVHVAVGALQTDPDPAAFALVVAAITLVGGLHLASIIKAPESVKGARGAGWLDVCAPGEIEDGRARIVTPVDGERIAVFHHEGRYFAISNVCAHQAGPLGEGRILDGCVTCPWHGWQYRPEDGRSPPPFDEEVATYRLRIASGRILVDPEALAPGVVTPPLDPGGSHG